MIPTPERVHSVLRMTTGTFDEVPFALLLHALASDRRNAAVELQRRAVRKELVLRDGVPTQCSSNLAHETLGRFMVSTGRLGELDANRYFAEAVTRGVLLGQVLVEREVCKPDELERALQHNLARKLLDGFTWREGAFAIHPPPHPLDVPLKVNVAQLILLGVSRFTPAETIGRVVAGLIGRKLARHLAPPLPGGDPPPTASQRRILELLGQPARIDELMSSTGLDPDELSRGIVALLMAGLISLADTSAAPRAVAVPRPMPAAAPPTTTSPPPARLEEERRRAAEVDMIFAMHRRLDPFALLGVAEDATSASIEASFVTFARRLAPWELEGETAARATVLLLAGARAYAALAEPSSRLSILERRKGPTTAPAVSSSPESDRIRTDLLDPEVQFAKGKTLMQAGRLREALVQLEYACDLDPQNVTYRAELAHCRFLQDPEGGAREALDELDDVLRIERSHGLALFYAGEIHQRLGNLDQARGLYEKAIKPLSGDRRPIDALRSLTAVRK